MRRWVDMLTGVGFDPDLLEKVHELQPALYEMHMNGNVNAVLSIKESNKRQNIKNTKSEQSSHTASSVRRKWSQVIRETWDKKFWIALIEKTMADIVRGIVDLICKGKNTTLRGTIIANGTEMKKQQRAAYYHKTKAAFLLLHFDYNLHD